MAHNQDWREWLESLNASGAEYVVVGDIDVFVHATPDNSQRVLNALRAFGFGSVQLTAVDLCTPDRVVQLGFPPGRIDILTSIDGVTWDEVSAGAVVGEYGGVPVRFIRAQN